MKKVLITGTAGFIGSRVAKEFLNNGYYVVGIDNLNDYYSVELKRYRKERLQGYENFEFRKIDIEDLKKLEELFGENDFDGVVNLAARAGVRYSIENPHVYFSTNVNGTLNLLELCKKYNIRKFIIASSSSLYAGGKMPFVESLSVDHPISPYAASKKAAENLCYTYHYLNGFNVTILRYFTVYGPAGRPDMAPFRFIKWIAEDTPITLYGDGTQKRDFTFVEDVAKGTFEAYQNIRGYEIINLGGNKPYEINHLISLIENKLDKKAKVDRKPFNKADMKATWANINKAKKLLNWEPKIVMEEGIKNTVVWYEKNKELVKKIKV